VKKINKKKIQFGIAFFSIILVISPTLANDCTWIPADIYGETFETQLLTKMSNLHVTSLAFSVLNGTEVFYSRGFGEQNGTDIAYHLNSACKMFTATAILQLYEQGLLDLEDDFNDYMPYVLKNPFYPNTTMTIKQLLSHRSSTMGSWHGFDDYWPSLNNGTCTFPSVIYEFLHENGTYYVEDNWENFEPGTSFLYSDVGMDILTLILENITSTPFDNYCQENIFSPLGMTNTRFSVEDYSPEELAIGYDWNTTTGTNDIMSYYNNSGNPGGGGYFSTADDMSKYMLAHLNQGEYNGVSILNATTIELMHTEVDYSKLGLGWWVRETFGLLKDYQGHPGGPHNGFYCANYMRYSLGVVLLLNQGVGAYSEFEDLYEYIFYFANKLLEDKCTTEANFYLIPLIASFGFMVCIITIRKKKKN